MPRVCQGACVGGGGVCWPIIMIIIIIIVVIVLLVVVVIVIVIIIIIYLFIYLFYQGRVNGMVALKVEMCHDFYFKNFKL